MLRKQDATPASGVIVVLLGYSLLFCLTTAIGRVCLGMDTAQASRYLPYSMLGFLGLYFHLLTTHTSKLRNSVLALFLLGSGFAAIHLTKTDQGTVYWLSHGKSDWKNCYLRAEDIQACDRTTGFKIYSNPAATRLKQKLEYLKANKLNLYADRE